MIQKNTSKAKGGAAAKQEAGNSANSSAEAQTILYQAVSGPLTNRLIRMVNPNQTAVKIARGELSAICRAVGVMQPKDSTELHDLPLVISGIQLETLLMDIAKGQSRPNARKTVNGHISCFRDELDHCIIGHSFRQIWKAGLGVSH